MIRTDSLGNQRWVRYYNVNAAIEVQNCLALPDNGALLVVSRLHPLSTFSIPIRVPTVIRVDSVGNVLWQREYGAPYSSFSDVRAMPDGSYALVGTLVRQLTNPSRLDSDVWLVRLTPDGDTIRTHTYRQAYGKSYGYGLTLDPQGGLLLTGKISPTFPPGSYQQGLLVQLDAQDREQWHHYAPAPRAHPTGAAFYKAYALPTPGQYVVAGYSIPTSGDEEGYMARFEHTPGGATTTAWETRFLKFGGLPLPNQYLLEANNTLTVADAGDPVRFSTDSDMLLTRFAGLPTVYQPPLCATPPVPNAAAIIPPAAPDSLHVLDIGSAGGQYAQLQRWRYEWGDGTTTERLTFGWVRHHYPGGHPPAGTPVRVTLTNNLGCASTQDLYPWGGRPTATAAPTLGAGATLHPNPATGRAVLTLPAAPAGVVRVAVRNALGQVVRQYAGAANGDTFTQVLELAGLAAGVYAVQVRTPAGQFVKRLVVE